MIKFFIIKQRRIGCKQPKKIMEYVINDDYKIRTDKRSYQLISTKLINKDVTKNAIRERTNNTIGYYARLSQVIDAIFEQEIRESEFKELKELFIYIESVKDEIKNSIKDISVQVARDLDDTDSKNSLEKGDNTNDSE